MNRTVRSMVLVLAATGLFIFQAQAAEVDAEVQSVISKRLHGLKLESIQSSPIRGLYRVSVPPRVFYVTGDGKYAFDGNVIDLESNQNITEQYRSRSLMSAVNGLGEDSMISFGPNPAKHTVTVFTDIDCAYCRKLHSAMPEYNKLGIRIRYLAYPRAGIGSASYNKAVSAWCTEDKKEALTRAKNGQPIPDKTCDNPVAKHYNLGNMIGISGTPALVLESGRVIPGFVPPDNLIAILDGKKTVQR